MKRAEGTTVSAITNGWRGSDLVIIGGRPNMGKTALMISLAAECAMNNDIPVAIFSLELSMMQLVKRLEQHSGVSRLPLHIDDASSIDIDYLHFKAKHLSEAEGVRIVFVDYLQLMRGDKVVKLLKSIASQLNITIVCLSQLPRCIEEREDKRPLLSDLEKIVIGASEYSDTILFIYREAYYDTHSDDDRAEIIVAKHYDDSLGGLELSFDRSKCVFIDK